MELNRALYGLLESARLWFEEVKSTLLTEGYVQNPKDQCIFNRMIEGKQLTAAVYVDDVKASCVIKLFLENLRDLLREKYGEFKTSFDLQLPYLGCNWDYSETGFVSVSQVGMIQDLITNREKTHLARGTPFTGAPHTPSAPYLYQRSEGSELLNDADSAQFRTDVGTALYIALRTRPDIAGALGEHCKRVKCPTMEDDRKLDRTIAYLRRTRDKPLRLGCTLPPQVTLSADASFANRAEMKSTSGACTTFGTGMFMTMSKQQGINSKSSCEAEIIAASDSMNKPLALRDFLHFQGYAKLPVVLEQDNQSAIRLFTNGRSNADATRFIDIRYFWISDYIARGEVELRYVPTADMSADYFTKPVQGAIFDHLVKTVMGSA